MSPKKKSKEYEKQPVTPSVETVKAMEQARNGTGVKSFESVDELMADLDAPLSPTPDIDAFKTALDNANARYHTSLKKLSEAADDDNSDIS